MNKKSVLKSKLNSKSLTDKSDLKTIQKALKKVSDPEKISVYQRFFKTGAGEYGEGDIFIGVTVPQNRKVCLEHLGVPMKELEFLLSSKIHEERLCALIILNEKVKKKIITLDEASKFYLKNKKCINNWDLVDTSAAYILGPYFYSQFKLEKSKKQISAKVILQSEIGKILFELVNSENLWDRRIAVITSLYFIRNGQFQLTMALCEMLLHDEADLMHKACGWMLREMGKKDENYLMKFLDQFASRMPRTMLRYSIEKLNQKSKIKYMKQKVDQN